MIFENSSEGIDVASPSCLSSFLRVAELAEVSIADVRLAQRRRKRVF
jgi:hypothetical protein